MSFDVTSTGKIEKLTTKELVKLYNKLAGTKITRFSSKEIGVRRTLEVLAHAQQRDKSPKDRKKGKRGKRAALDLPEKKNSRTPRWKTRRGKALKLLLRGVKMTELMKETGWDEKSMIHVLKIINSYLGYSIVESPDTGMIFAGRKNHKDDPDDA